MKVTKLIQRGTELLEGQSMYLDEKSKYRKDTNIYNVFLMRLEMKCFVRIFCTP